MRCDSRERHHCCAQEKSAYVEVPFIVKRKGWENHQAPDGCQDGGANDAAAHDGAADNDGARHGAAHDGGTLHERADDERANDERANSCLHLGRETVARESRPTSHRATPTDREARCQHGAVTGWCMHDGIVLDAEH